MMNRFYAFLLALPVFALVLWVGCSNNEVAGGVSEETNTIAGVLVDKKGSPVVSAMVYCKSVDVDSVESSDMTDSKGRYRLPVKRHGTYGISAAVDSLAYYEVVEFKGKDVQIRSVLVDASDFRGRILLREDSTAAGIVVRIPGSPWTATTDSLGYYRLEGLPVGKVNLQVVPMDLARFVKVDRQVEIGLLAAGAVDSLMVPLSPEYGLRSWWNFADVEGSVDFVKDSRSWTAGMNLYGKPGFDSAVHFKGANQFGVVEDDRGMLDNQNAFAVEAVLQVDKVLDDSVSFRRNLVGKLGFGSEEDRPVFSLSVVKGMCGTDKEAFAFFMAGGNGDSLSCKNAVVSKKGLEFGKLYYLMATWNGKKVALYEDGKKVGETEVSIEKISPSEESIFVGKEALEFSMEELRISVEPLNEADAESRNLTNRRRTP